VTHPPVATAAIAITNIARLGMHRWQSNLHATASAGTSATVGARPLNSRRRW
jgi:hypothetical protein